MNFDLSPDQQQLQGRVHEFAQREVAPVAEQLDRDGVFPTALFKKLGDLGVMSIPFSEELGGMGLGVFDAVLALEEVARADQSLAVSAMVSMATGLTVSRFGTRQQIDQWLPEIVTGQKMCAIAGTEPDAGSDTAGFKTSGQNGRQRSLVDQRREGLYHQRGHRHFDLHAAPDGEQPGGIAEEAVHAISGAERVEGLRARRALSQARLALV